jgi:hypothetical protein
MAPNAPKVAGIAASDHAIKGMILIAPIKHAAPIAKQTMPSAIFSPEPIVIRKAWYRRHNDASQRVHQSGF